MFKILFSFFPHHSDDFTGLYKRYCSVTILKLRFNLRFFNNAKTLATSTIGTLSVCVYQNSKITAKMLMRCSSLRCDSTY